MDKSKQKGILLILSVVIMIIGLSGSFIIQTDFGRVVITDVNLRTSEDVLIHSTLHRPLTATSTNPLPGVIVIHGSMQSKEWLSAFSIELSKREFVVLSIDAAAHGNSDSVPTDISDRGGLAAIDYLNNLNYIDKIGLIGHSMGSGISTTAINETSEIIDAFVVVGGWIGNYSTAIHPKNLLITVGKYDELIRSSRLESLQVVFNITSEVVIGQTYGNFEDGTARKYYISDLSNHLFETVDPNILSETVKWMEKSLRNPESSLSNLSFSYHFNMIFGLISLIGLVFSVIMVFSLIVDSNIIGNIVSEDQSQYIASSKVFWGGGLIYGALALVAFIPAMLISIPFPQSNGGTVGLWMLLSGIIALIFLVFMKKKSILTWTDFGLGNFKENISLIGKNIVLALITFTWLAFIVIIVDMFTFLDFRVFLPFFKSLTFKRLIIAPLYLIFAIPYFLIDGLFINGLLRKSYDRPVKTYVETVIVKILPFTLILITQLIMSIIIGSAFISGITGYYLLFFWMFVPFFIITTFIHIFFYQYTKRIYAGVVFNSLLFSWMIASILAILI